ncbi:MAG: hypothetical protein ACI4HK_08450 [Ruminococcus sp.]
MSVTLRKIEMDILSRGISVGNEVLYTLCKDYPLLKENNPKDMNEERKLQGLAAELWLIGRSYAASPERRDYGEKVEWTNSGNGLDTYFDLLADKLWSDGYYDELKIIVENLENLGKYKLDQSFKENDKQILVSVIANVLKFNALLKEIRFAVDEKELSNHVGDNKEKLDVLKNNQKNMLSFSSKFLHFHFPDVVFIFDTITKDHFKGPREKHHFKFENTEKENCIVESDITLSKDEINTLISEIRKIKYNDDSEIGKYDKSEEYSTHCVREYLLAREIKKASPKIFDGENTYIPRLIDTYMLMTNTKTKKKNKK